MDSRRPELGADANPRARAASRKPQATTHEQIPRQRHHAYGYPNDTDAVAAVNSQPPSEAGGKDPNDQQGSNAVDRPDCPAESHAVRRLHSHPNTANRRRRQTGTDAAPSLEAGSTTRERIPREQHQAYACSTGSQRRRIDQAARQLDTTAQANNATGRDSERREADPACSRAALPMRTERMRRTRTAPARRRHAAGTPRACRIHAASTPHVKGTHRACGMHAAPEQSDRTVHAACSAAVRTMKAARSRDDRRRTLPRAHTDQPNPHDRRAGHPDVMKRVTGRLFHRSLRRCRLQCRLPRLVTS